MQKASSSKKVKWIKTKHSNLYRNNDSGTYYARIQINGKEKWKSLKTKIQENSKAENGHEFNQEANTLIGSILSDLENP